MAINFSLKIWKLFIQGSYIFNVFFLSRGRLFEPSGIFFAWCDLFLFITFFSPPPKDIILTSPLPDKDEIWLQICPDFSRSFHNKAERRPVLTEIEKREKKINLIQAEKYVCIAIVIIYEEKKTWMPRHMIFKHLNLLQNIT